MASQGWREFRSSDDPAVRFDYAEGRFLRMRSRKLDDQSLGRAYLIVDLAVLRAVDVEYRNGRRIVRRALGATAPVRVIRSE